MNEQTQPVLVRFYHPDYGRRFGLRLGGTVYDLSGAFPSVASWLQTSVGRVAEAILWLERLTQQAPITFPADIFQTATSAGSAHMLAPVDEQEVWAAGVTYERSRAARQEEAVDGGDVYARVYSADRPELFFKASGHNVVGPGAPVGIRQDANWSVPEPELAVIFNPVLEVVGFSIGNDMSSRDIEGENPLYLPQAKMYTASCALGPGIVLTAAQSWPDTTIRLSILRGSQVAFHGAVPTSRIRRSISELAAYLGRCMAFPDGVVLLTGTGIVPPPDFSLAAGDVVQITIEGIGMLTNPVVIV